MLHDAELAGCVNGRATVDGKCVKAYLEGDKAALLVRPVLRVCRVIRRVIVDQDVAI